MAMLNDGTLYTACRVTGTGYDEPFRLHQRAANTSAAAGLMAKPTKRYFAPSSGSGQGDGQQLALRIDNGLEDVLYYTLSDSTGTSLTLVDAQGNLTGTILYDAYGGVLTATVPVTITSALAGQGALPDPAAGLVHFGSGRWYDPGLGRPLQPNPMGGPPSVPQALNRYAATSVGQPGVMEAVANTWNPFDDPYISNVGRDALSVGVKEIIARGLKSHHRASLIRTPIWRTQTRLVARSQFVDDAVTGLSNLVGARPGSLWGRFAEFVTGINTKEVSEQRIVAHYLKRGSRSGTIAGSLAWTKLGKTLDLGIGLGVDIGFQVWMDWDDPYLTGKQRLRRVGVATLGSGASFGAGLLGLGVAEAAGLSTVGVLGGPAGWVAIGTAIVVSIAWDIWIAPQVYEFVGAESERKLAPMN